MQTTIITKLNTQTETRLEYCDKDATMLVRTLGSAANDSRKMLQEVLSVGLQCEIRRRAYVKSLYINSNTDTTHEPLLMTATRLSL